jgi:ATP phosphoribosyltransferase
LLERAPVHARKLEAHASLKRTAAQEVLGEMGIRHTIFPVNGGSESFAQIDAVDAVFEIVETGNSLKEAGLFVNHTVGTLQFMVIRRKH